MEEMLATALWNILLLIITVLGGMLIKWLAEKVGIEKMRRAQAQWDSMQDLASVAVKYAEQAYREFIGETKKEQAMAFLSRSLAELGIKASEETLSDLIEAMLREIKDVLGEQWANTVNEETAE